MKKVVLSLFLMAALLFVGCSQNTVVSSSSTVIVPDSVVSSSSEAEVSSAVSEPEEVFSYAAMIPDVDSILGVEYEVTDPDGGTAYAFRIDGATQSQFEQYVAEVKRDGVFTDVTYDTSTDFGAYSSDAAYWIQVNFDKDTMYVICQEARNK